MKAVLCKEFGPPSSLVVEDIAPPKLGAGEVRIAIHAAGVNFPDTLIIKGAYQNKPSFPFVPGMEAAGIVTEIAPGVKTAKVGNRVMASTSTGSFAEECVVAETSVYVIPDSMDFVLAAAFPVTYGTTYHALVDRGHLKAGEWLLVHGAGGGVGLSAVEVGKLLGARVIATAGSVEKLEMARQYGAEALINYRNESIRDRVKEITGDTGADVIYDAVGGDVFDQSLRCIAWNGRLLVIGFASGRIPAAPANLLLLKGCSAVGVFWGSFTQREPERNRGNFHALLKWVAEGKIKPHVSATWPLEGVPEAMQALLDRKVTGKAVIRVRQN